MPSQRSELRKSISYTILFIYTLIPWTKYVTEICCLVTEFKSERDCKRAWSIFYRWWNYSVFYCGDGFLGACVCQSSPILNYLHFLDVTYTSINLKIIYFFCEKFYFSKMFSVIPFKRNILSYLIGICFSHALTIFLGQQRVGKRNVCHFWAGALKAITWLCHSFYSYLVLSILNLILNYEL